MKEQGTDTEKLMKDIEELFVKTLILIQPELSHHYRTCQPGDIERDLCFELLGFDVYIDKNAKPWILEVNLAPSFQANEEIDLNLKKPLIYDSFKLLNATHNERVRKMNRKREENQR